jgi:hypothetical protein
VRSMHLLYTLQKICLGNLVPNMCYMLSDINVMRIALMCKEAWLYARVTYLVLVQCIYHA